MYIYFHVYDCFLYKKSIKEPRHNKTNKGVACGPSEDSDQPGHPPSLIRVFAVRMKKSWVLSYSLSAQRRLWSDWAHSHFVGFFMSWLKRTYSQLLSYNVKSYLSLRTIKQTIWPVRSAKIHISMGICPVWSVLAISGGQQRLLNMWDCEATQADLCLHRCIGHFVCFVPCHEYEVLC